MVPENRYAKRGDVHIAYQVFGDGAVDLVMIPVFISIGEIDDKKDVLVRGMSPLFGRLGNGGCLGAATADELRPNNKRQQR